MSRNFLLAVVTTLVACSIEVPLDPVFDAGAFADASIPMDDAIPPEPDATFPDAAIFPDATFPMLPDAALSLIPDAS